MTVRSTPDVQVFLPAEIHTIPAMVWSLLQVSID